MGMSTDEKDIGDLYIMKKTSPQNANLKINGYDFVSEKIAKNDDLKENAE